MFIRSATLLMISLLLSPLAAQSAVTTGPISHRAPAYPLVVHDPYFSIWSTSDKLTDEWSKHWTGATHAMCGMVNVDGKTYRWMGILPNDTAIATQTACVVTPTATTYTFEAGGARLKVRFFTPAFPDDLDIMSRPITYVVFDYESADGKPHSARVYFDASSEIAVNHPSQPVQWSRLKAGKLAVMRIGSQEQPVLAKKGDDLRIDWGHLYLACSENGNGTFMGEAQLSRESFAKDGSLPAYDEANMPRPASEKWPGIACSIFLGDGIQPTRHHLMIGYDDQWSIEYLQRRLRPYWRRTGMDMLALLEKAEAEAGELMSRGEKYDTELLQDADKIGGECFKRLISLSHRQAIGAHKLVADFDGTPLFFSKENFSNGCIATVDVTYPSAPMFLLLNPTLLKGMTTPILDYAGTHRWKFPFAPHDLGTYPLANGQVYGGGEKTEENQMPVEECGNMLILAAAIAHADGNTSYVQKYMPLLKKWADYLLEKGLDPENQLCTDDFMGHLAHNTNLSLKAIIGIAGYAQLCEKTGDASSAARYRKHSEQMAAEWMKKADDGGRNYRLAFDKPGTWSQKYNLVWDEILGLKLFPPEVSQKEVKRYADQREEYGTALDNRGDVVKIDWQVWIAVLADSREEFLKFLVPICRFLEETPDRVPMTDWYSSKTGKKIGFQARSVVGGLYIPYLYDADLWKKWRERAGN